MQLYTRTMRYFRDDLPQIVLLFALIGIVDGALTTSAVAAEGVDRFGADT